MKSKLERLKLGFEPALAPLIALTGKRGWKSALEMGQAAAERVYRAIEIAAADLKDSRDPFRNYVDSDEFERDLDELAHRLGIDSTGYPAGGTNRWVRVSAKSRYVLLRARDQIVAAGSTGAVLGGATLNPKVILALTIAFAGVKLGHQSYHAFQIFFPSRSVPVSEPA